ncbi:Transcription factor [Apiospora aurea]|uniref:Transcription factor n=1 Tax=Apiospora aurea TaxID=335848 RepID=A0ABR1PTP6_9PEZI
MGLFSSYVKPNDIRPFFAKAGLNWDVGEYCRMVVAINPTAAANLTITLPAQYSQKAQFLKGVEATAILYGFDNHSESDVLPLHIIEDRTETAIAFAQVGRGKIGYVGDVNVEEETDAVVLAMIGL